MSSRRKYLAHAPVASALALTLFHPWAETPAYAVYTAQTFKQMHKPADKLTENALPQKISLKGPSVKFVRFLTSGRLLEEQRKTLTDLRKVLLKKYHPDKYKKSEKPALLINSTIAELLDYIDASEKFLDETEGAENLRADYGARPDGNKETGIVPVDKDPESSHSQMSPQESLAREDGLHSRKNEADPAATKQENHGPDWKFSNDNQHENEDGNHLTAEERERGHAILERMSHDRSLNQKLQELMDLFEQANLPMPKNLYKLFDNYRDEYLKDHHLLFPVNLLDPHDAERSPIFASLPHTTAHAALEVEETHPVFPELVSLDGRFGNQQALFDVFGQATSGEIARGLRFAGRDSRGVVQVVLGENRHYILAENLGSGALNFRTKGANFSSLDDAIGALARNKAQGGGSGSTGASEISFVMTRSALLYRLGFFPAGGVTAVATPAALENLGDFHATDPLRMVYQCFHGNCRLQDRSLKGISKDMTAMGVPGLGIVKDSYANRTGFDHSYYAAVYDGKTLQFYDRSGLPIDLEKLHPVARKFGMVGRQYYEDRSAEENTNHPMLPYLGDVGEGDSVKTSEHPQGLPKTGSSKKE